MTDREPTPRFNIWPWVPVVLLTTMVGGLLFMAKIATDDPGFAVEKDYYKKAVAWDDHRAQLAENGRLGWKLSLQTKASGGDMELVAKLTDDRGRAVPGARVRVEAFANARAGHIVSAELSSAPDGTLRGKLPLYRAGLWEFRFSAEQNGARFTKIIRQDVAEGDAT
jgi:hypothetical protein